jgi:hypothetical protein
MHFKKKFTEIFDLNNLFLILNKLNLHYDLFTFKFKQNNF